MPEALALALRVALSLAAVLVLMWLVARVLRGRSGSATGSLEVLARQQVGRTASVAVVRVGGRALVVGVTEQSVSLLGETELPASPAPTTAPAAPAVAPKAATVALPPAPPEGLLTAPVGADGALQLLGATPQSGPLAGSILSPTTWRTTVHLVRERTVRRG